MNVLVGEDDPTQRERLVRMIGGLKPEWTQVAHVSTAAGVLAAVADFQPEVLVLDIHLGVADTRWIRQLPRNAAIVFVTGDANLAVQAFDLAAVDYVMKPAHVKRLEKALERAETRVSALSMQTDVAEPLDTVVGARGTELVMFHVHELCFLQAHNKYTRLVSASQEALVRTTISEFERRLDLRYFKRIHRGTLVNLRLVQRVWRDGHGRMRVSLPCNGDDLQVSRAFEAVFRVD